MKYKTLLFLVVLTTAVHVSMAQKTVVQGKPSLQDRFPKKSGNVLFSDLSLSFSRLFDNQTATMTLRFYNAAGYDIQFSTPKVPEYFTVEITPVLKPKAEGTLKVTYDAGKRKDYGFVIDQLSILTNDSQATWKYISIATIIEPFLPPMTADDSLQAPVAVLSDSVFDYQTIKQGDIARRDIVVTNGGKRDLKIYAVKTTCGCIGATLDKYLLAPGESVPIHASFNSVGKNGRDSHELVLYTNDPRKKKIEIEVKGLTLP